MIAVTTIEKIEAMKKARFFFYLSIVVGYGSIPKRVIGRVLPRSHELIAHPLRFSFLLLIISLHLLFWLTITSHRRAGSEESFVVHRGKGIPTLSSVADEKSVTRADAAGRPSNWEDQRRSSYAGRRSRRNSVSDDSQLTIENFGGSQVRAKRVTRNRKSEKGRWNDDRVICSCRIIYTTSAEIQTRRSGRTSGKGAPRSRRYRRDRAFRTCTVAGCSTFCRTTDTTRKSRQDWEGRRPTRAWTTSRSSKFYIPARTSIRKVTRPNWPASRIWAGKARRRGSTWRTRNRIEMTGNRICPVRSLARRMVMGTVMRRRLRSPLCRTRPRGNSRAASNPNRWNNILLVCCVYVVFTLYCVFFIFRWYERYNHIRQMKTVVTPLWPRNWITLDWSWRRNVGT